MNDNRFTLRFSGVADLKPQVLRAKELAEILENIEAAVVSAVVARDPTLKREQIAVALVGVTDHSVGLTFAPNLQELTFPALERIAQAIATNQIGTLPGTVIKPLRSILYFVRNRGCTAELAFTHAGTEFSATLTPTTRIEKVKPLRGETTLYGEVVRVGGVEPKVEIKTVDGKALFCPTTEQIARQLAERLYQQVAVQGIATWNAASLEIEEFQVTGVLSYVPVELSQAFQQLRERAQGAYDTIGDVEQYIHTLRYSEE